MSDIPFSLVARGASAGSALFVAAEADGGALPAAGAGSVSSKSSRLMTGAGAGSGALPAVLDFVVDVRV